MAGLIWSPQASADLVEICAFIGRDSGLYASHFAREVIARVEQLPRFPYAGRIVPEYNRSDLREKIFQNYRIVYRVHMGGIEIVAVVHGNRLLRDAIQDQ